MQPVSQHPTNQALAVPTQMEQVEQKSLPVAKSKEGNYPKQWATT